ncbi:hypothetical protein D9M72_579150 [compost metagenome]
MLADPLLRNSGSAYFETRKVPVTLTEKTRFQSSRLVSSMVFSISMPAAFTRMSSLPACSRTADMA